MMTFDASRQFSWSLFENSIRRPEILSDFGVFIPLWAYSFSPPQRIAIALLAPTICVRLCATAVVFGLNTVVCIQATRALIRTHLIMIIVVNLNIPVRCLARMLSSTSHQHSATLRLRVLALTNASTISIRMYIGVHAYTLPVVLKHCLG